jgi:hypothetical protein
MYLESRVGKVPGIRGKKRHVQSGEAGRPQIRSFVATHPSTPSATIATAVPIPAATTTSPLPEFLHATHDEPWQWTTTSQLDSTETSFDFLNHIPGSSTEFGSSESMVTTSVADEFMPDLHFDMDEILNSPPPQRRSPSTMRPPMQTASASTPASQQCLFEEAQKARKECDSKCVIHCCQLINDLENYIVADMEAFQIVSGIVRKAFERLNELIAQQQGSRNLRCLMLLCTVCYQILELLQMCQKTIASPSSQRRTSMLMPGSFGLGLGGFGYDEEEQSAWQMQRILKEINHGCETVQKISKLAGVGPDHTTSSATPEAAAREYCFKDLEQRFKDLATRVK